METRELVIIGGGPAGLAAAIYGARAALNPLILERGVPGGQAATTEWIENYPGFEDGIGGFELMVHMHRQAEKFGAEFKNADVMGIKKENGIFILNTSTGEIGAKTVIIATGAEPKELGVPGEREFRGRGVSYCATCDGNFFRGKTVAVVGGGDSALEEAIYLTKLVEKVYLIHRREGFRAAKVVQQRAKANPKIEFVLNTVVEEIAGERKVEKVVVKNVQTGEKSEIPVDGVFIYVGLKPNTAFLEGFLELENGYIKTDENMATAIPGLFAAGDVRLKDLRQVVTAVADGAQAAVSAEKYLEENK
ncbi:thioredoxin-disulfide reductase [Carboxydothermus islandicus]|uniref:Thioredoxin reductase n=1 Tax=Carboxydothermus islandicus TaxID=661089 RepID=A0A1L8D4I1_9THEO|nr:thioredoxin-disulfide reductase [Carboxydothermus islandicus]GAV26079.1 thioredoxin-disulfide reductase [Carboxydothermus islandicus]